MRSIAVWMILGFGFWGLVVLALEPGNVLGAWAVGRAVPVTEELRRIAAASFLGAAVMPLQALIARRLPVAGDQRLGMVALQAMLLSLLALAMLTVAHLTSPLVLSAANPRLHTTFSEQAGADFAILFAALVAASALIQSCKPRLGSITATGFAEHITTGMKLVAVAQIDWLETQGNYVALHVGTKAHLVRKTLTQVEAQLDPDQFLRIHRRILVNRSRLVEMRRLGGGDAVAILCDGTELRSSRTYAEALRQAFR